MLSDSPFQTLYLYFSGRRSSSMVVLAGGRLPVFIRKTKKNPDGLAFEISSFGRLLHPLGFVCVFFSFSFSFCTESSWMFQYLESNIKSRKLLFEAMQGSDGCFRNCKSIIRLEPLMSDRTLIVRQEYNSPYNEKA